jgi:hypothetical protein
MAAALAAARAGADVCLVEARPRLGGTVSSALIHTLGGFYDSGGEFLNGGLPQELAQALTRADARVRRRRIGRTWVLSVDPQVYRSMAERWVESEPRITVLSSARVYHVICEADRVAWIEAAGPDCSFRFPTRAVVDATGTGEVVRLIDPGLIQEDGSQAAGLIFTLRGIEPNTMAFPKGLGIIRALQSAVADGTLPADCGKTWLDSGLNEDEVYVKLLVRLPADWRDPNGQAPVLRQALSAQTAVVSFLQRLPGFVGCRVTQTGEIGIREGGRVRGEYCLREADVRQSRKFADAACRCCWPIEYWDPDQGVSLEYLPDNDYYEIPLRALRVQGLQNVWIAGKCLSAERYAQASARVVGSCWAMGEAAGRAAAGQLNGKLP